MNKKMRFDRIFIGIATLSIALQGGSASATEVEQSEATTNQLKVIGDVPENWVVVRDAAHSLVEQSVELADGSKKMVLVPQVILQPTEGPAEKEVIISTTKLEKAVSLQSRQLVNAEVQMESVLEQIHSLLSQAKKAN